MSNQNLVKAPTKAELEAKAAAEAEALKLQQEKEAAEKLKADQEAEALKNQVESTNDTTWVSPLDVNYIELTALLGDTNLVDYIGDRLPDDEVKRIETDYAIYLKNK